MSSVESHDQSDSSTDYEDIDVWLAPPSKSSELLPRHLVCDNTRADKTCSSLVLEVTGTDVCCKQLVAWDHNAATYQTNNKPGSNEENINKSLLVQGIYDDAFSFTGFEPGVKAVEETEDDQLDYEPVEFVNIKMSSVESHDQSDSSTDYEDIDVWLAPPSKSSELLPRHLVCDNTRADKVHTMYILQKDILL
ncbi:uncharacterized protein LOC121370322 [Gigantopelta aegis]|uniref:uncharacterized protein LOC121370322 n=1 Tax=Gigantopelta aegis TaxID=1735272 RepID=UPI001B88D164|nr:uncharacterized protein LOC121370322 [Gigantopelta aegis]